MLSGPRFISPVAGSLSRMVVFLHGYGASGEDLLPIAYEWQSALPPSVFYAPNAPETSEVASFGYQWFGLPDLSPTTIRSGLDQVRPILLNYIQSLLTEHQLNQSDLAIVGFSQGAMIALDTLFYMPHIACIVGYSGAFYPPVEPSALAENKTNVLLIHGTEDTVVPYASLKQAKKQLEFMGLAGLHTHTCNGLGHGIDADGMQVGLDFLSRHLSHQTQPVMRK